MASQQFYVHPATLILTVQFLTVLDGMKFVDIDPTANRESEWIILRGKQASAPAVQGSHFKSSSSVPLQPKWHGPCKLCRTTKEETLGGFIRVHKLSLHGMIFSSHWVVRVFTPSATQQKQHWLFTLQNSPETMDWHGKYVAASWSLFYCRNKWKLFVLLWIL